MKEIWRKIDGYSYEVSNLGRVRRIGGAILLQAQVSGRSHVCLCRPSAVKGEYVNTLVAAAFLGPRPKGADIHHKDRDGSNNRVHNLEYLQRPEHTHKDILLGSGSGGQTLNVEAVRVIKWLLRHRSRPGLASCIARAYKVNPSTIHRIKTGECWSYV